MCVIIIMFVQCKEGALQISVIIIINADSKI